MGKLMLIRGDARQIPLRDGCVQCVVTSPPYFGLRDYGVPGQIGLETTPADYVEMLVAVVFEEIKRVLRPDGTVWVVLGDSFVCSPRGNKAGDLSTSSLTNPHRQDRVARPHGATAQRVDRASVGSQLSNYGRYDGLKAKDLIGIPWRVAFALQAHGWYLRSDIIWSKPNPMPESVTDRPTKAHEYIFLLSKSARYFYDADAIAEQVSAAMISEVEQGYDGLGLKDYEGAGVQNPSSVKARIIANAKRRTNHVEGLSLALPVADQLEQVEGRMAIETFRSDDNRRKVKGLSRESEGLKITGNIVGRGDGGASCNNPRQLTRNRRSVWTVNTEPYPGAHFATYPVKLIEPCILAGSRIGDLVLDPFVGSGTTCFVAERLGRRAVGIDLSYQDLARERTAQRGLLATTAEAPSDC